MRIILLTLLPLLIMACGDLSDDHPAEAQNRIVVDTLIVSDSIGVLAGDSSYMFGYIACAEALPGGGAILLDQRTGLVSSFDSEARFISSLGGLGEAPGRFNRPSLMTVLGDGRIAVIDWMDREVVFFSPEGEYLGSRTTPHRDTPLDIRAAGDSGYVIYSTPIRQVEGTFRMGFEVNIWQGMDQEPAATVFSHLFDFGQENYDFRPGYLAVAADEDGRVYLHRMNSDEYLIEVFGPYGNSIDSIASEPVILTWEQAERYCYVPQVMFGVQDEGETHQVRGEMTEYLPQVERMGIDSIGNLWAQRGTSVEIMWDVFDPQGEQTQQVYLTSFPDTVFMRIQVNEHGIVGWNLAPEDYPKLYFLEYKE